MARRIFPAFAAEQSAEHSIFDYKREKADHWRTCKSTGSAHPHRRAHSLAIGNDGQK